MNTDSHQAPRRRGFFFAVFFFTAVIVGFLHACSPGSGDTATDNAKAAQANGILLDSKTIEVPASLPTASSAYQFDYSMAAVTGGTTTAKAQLFAPSGQQPAQGYPLVVWAHGTTGISNACAPSLSFTNFGNSAAINSLLDAGYAVLAPDYEGFGTPTIHPYYLRSSHANAVLSALPAAHELDNTKLSADWAVVGHSQGGHVALASARAEQNPEFPLRAVVALAPGTDLEALSVQAFKAIDDALAEGNLNDAADRVFYLNVYGGYIAQAIALIEPEFDPNPLFGETVAKLLDTALDEKRCGDYARAIGQAVRTHLTTGGTLEEFEGLRKDWFTEPALTDFLQQEELGDEKQAAPLLIVQGEKDRQIPVAATTAFVDRQRSLGTDVTYEVIPGARHGDVALAEFGFTVDWLIEQFSPN